MNNLRAVRAAGNGLAFLAAYVAFDILSGPEARLQVIAPVWHPAAGLALYALLRYGRHALLPLFAAALVAAAITPALPARPGFSLLVGLLPLPVYAAAGWLTRRLLPGSAFFASHRGLLSWAGIVTLASIAGAVLYAGMLLGSAAFAGPAWIEAVTRYAVAETAGMLVIVPAAWCLLDPALRAEALQRVRTPETLAYAALIALVLSIALQGPALESFAYHLLILPLAWAAARQGMAGAIAAAIVLEAGVTVAALRPLAYAAHMPDVQMLVLTLTLSGFLIGIAVDVARRASDELRQSLRLAAAGEMAAALAHELNQPLTALSAYGSACQRLAERGGGPLPDPLLQKTIAAMVAESQRASNVLKRLREFFRTGSVRLEPLSLPALVQAGVDSLAVQAREAGIKVEVGTLPAASLLGDGVQLEIVLRNLLANAIQALAELPEGLARRVTVDAGLERGKVWIRIADNGPGIAPSIRARLFEPFVSLKSSGLGLGLAISRAIVEAHGGSLAAAPGRHAVLTIVLPAQLPDEKEEENEKRHES
ncbi:ATP-binding protein [Telluria sp. B2]